MAELRAITQEEWDAYEWIEVEPGVYIKGFKRTLPPDPPDDGFAYKTIEVTKFGDTERKYELVKLLTYD